MVGERHENPKKKKKKYSKKTTTIHLNAHFFFFCFVMLLFLQLMSVICEGTVPPYNTQNASAFEPHR